MRFSFQLTVTNDKQTGEILAVYLRIRKGKVAKVRELEDGAVFANYGKKGELLGIEMLAPCRLSVLDRIARDEPATRKFVRGNVPRDMVLAGA
jgi:hypothetical protein